jgi:hypothetical protein
MKCIINFMLSQWFVVNVVSDFGFLHHVAVERFADILEVHAAYMYMVSDPRAELTVSVYLYVNHYNWSSIWCIIPVFDTECEESAINM